MTRRLTIGTRGSPLALAQAALARRALEAAHPGITTGIAVIRTAGDRAANRPLAEIGGKGLFTGEIDEALLAGRIDVAVHSLKDVPTLLPDGIVLGCHLEREDPRDAWISRDGGGIASLPAGAVVGTASLRRAAQVLRRRPDVAVAPLRGNVGTRLDKLALRRESTPPLLALAGLRRLGMEDAATAVLDPDEMLPAVGQGVVAIACRRSDSRVRARLSALDDASTTAAAAAERAMLARLDGSCRTPIAGLAQIAPDGRLTLPWPSSPGPTRERNRRPVGNGRPRRRGRGRRRALGRRLAERAGDGFRVA